VNLQVIPEGVGSVNPLFESGDLFSCGSSPACERAGIGVEVLDRPAGPTAERPEVLDVDAARRTLFEAEKKLSSAPSGPG
jgi:hypothetical protein